MIALQRSTIAGEVGGGLGADAATASAVLDLGFTLCTYQTTPKYPMTPAAATMITGLVLVKTKIAVQIAVSR